MIIKFRSIFENANLQQVKLNKDLKISKLAYKCKPFIEGYTYGFEFLYPYETTITIANNNNVIKFLAEDNWEKDAEILNKVQNKPIGSIDDGFFGLASGLDIQVPQNYLLRIEPHPSTFFSAHSPIAVPGNIETDWWSSLIFIVFKTPIEGQEFVIKKNDPLAQFLVVPNPESLQVEKMTLVEEMERQNFHKKINDNRKNLSKSYQDKNGNFFDSTYKTLANAIKKYGKQNTIKLIENFKKKVDGIKKILFKKNGAPKSP